MPRQKDGHRWTENDLLILGTDTDIAIAEKLGLTETAVYHARKYYNIPAANSHKREYSEAEIQLLRSDAPVSTIADLCGMTRAMVYRWRQKDQMPVISEQSGRECLYCGNTGSHPEYAGCCSLKCLEDYWTEPGGSLPDHCYE